MSEDIQLGRFETTHGDLQNILQWGVAPFDERYDQMYLNLAEDELRTIANAGESVVAYNTYEDPFVQDVELDESSEEGGMEAIVNVPNMQDYLAFVGGERVTVEFYGSEDTRGASYLKLKGDLSATMYLPASEKDYESKALKIVKKYDEEDRWMKEGDEHLSTSFTTTVEQFDKIVDAKSFDHLSLSSYPVVIEDGEFRLDASDENERDGISGTLWTEDVEGPDVHNNYTRAFDELFNNISGKVYVETEQDSLLNVVRESNDGAFAARYCILPAA